MMSPPSGTSSEGAVTNVAALFALPGDAEVFQPGGENIFRRNVFRPSLHRYLALGLALVDEFGHAAKGLTRQAVNL